MQQINVYELKPHPRNNEFFDDMSGEAWEAFKESIRTSGVIEPIVITPEKIIISGHQRVRACKELNISTILTDMRAYDNEDQILKDLIETNIRQRGIGNPNPVKLGRCIKELERIYDIKQGGSGYYGNQYEESRNNFVTPKTQSDLADELDMDVRTLQNYKLLAEMIPEMEELLDTGIVTKTTILAIMRELSEEEQRELISSLDITEKITKSKMQSYIDEIRELKNNNTHLYSKEIDNLKDKINDLESQKRCLETKIKLNEDDANRYQNLKSEIDFLIKQKTDLGRQIESATELAGLTVKLQELLENELAPIKFKRCMEELENGDVAFQNLSDVVSLIDEWSLEIKNILNSCCNYDVVIDVQ